ncbi:MAG TPA: hypothetical protein DCE41_17285 [Cytophagales bacterium]|nr:hypothetical protein [Cytophagales bacterium]HAA23884.1 hypothetical protein [Cytophagales bacterium]HAP60952.1 hypothetical protein [Cytophagales bacterium]
MIPSLFWKRRYRKLYAHNWERVRNCFFYTYGHLAHAEELADQVLDHLRKFGRIFSYTEAQRFLYIEMRTMIAQLPNEPGWAARGKSLSFVQLHTEKHEEVQFLGDHHLLQENLETVFALLPMRLRQVFLLHRIDQQSPTEIASILGMPVGKVEAALIEAIERMTPPVRKAS